MPLGRKCQHARPSRAASLTMDRMGRSLWLRHISLNVLSWTETSIPGLYRRQGHYHLLPSVTLALGKQKTEQRGFVWPLPRLCVAQELMCLLAHASPLNNLVSGKSPGYQLPDWSPPPNLDPTWSQPISPASHSTPCQREAGHLAPSLTQPGCRR